MTYISPTESGQMRRPSTRKIRVEDVLKPLATIARSIANDGTNLALLAAYGASRDRKQAHDEAAALLAFIGLASKSHVAAIELAHGDSQHLDIAMALASRPSLLLLDEPTAGLNPEEIRQLGAMLTELKGLISTVVITHDFQFVASLDAPVVVMSRGSIFRIGSVKELREDNGFIDLYLGRDTASARAS